jgi:hypothetical protein
LLDTHVTVCTSTAAGPSSTVSDKSGTIFSLNARTPVSKRRLYTHFGLLVALVKFFGKATLQKDCQQLT